MEEHEGCRFSLKREKSPWVIECHIVLKIRATTSECVRYLPDMDRHCILQMILATESGGGGLLADLFTSLCITPLLHCIKLYVPE